MTLGTVLVFAALSLFLWNRREETNADLAAQEILVQVAKVAEQPRQNKNEAPVSTDPTTYIDPTMTEVVIDDYPYIGYLSIPALSLELPIMSAWTNHRLRVAPCRYSGSTKTDDLVLLAHNYISHFGRLGELRGGETIYFTDMDGDVHTYEVVTLETLEPTDVEEMTSGEYDLTLFTCTYGGRSRVTVRCDRT